MWNFQRFLAAMLIGDAIVGLVLLWLFQMA